MKYLVQWLGVFMLFMFTLVMCHATRAEPAFTTTIETTGLDIVATKTEAMLDHVANALTKATEVHGPKIVDLSLEVVRISALSHVIQSVFGTILALIVLGLIAGMVHIGIKRWRWDGFDVTMTCVISGILPTILLASSLYKCMQVHYWVGIWRPEVLLAHKIMVKFIGL